MSLYHIYRPLQDEALQKGYDALPNRAALEEASQDIFSTIERVLKFLHKLSMDPKKTKDLTFQTEIKTHMTKTSQRFADSIRFSFDIVD